MKNKNENKMRTILNLIQDLPLSNQKRENALFITTRKRKTPDQVQGGQLFIMAKAFTLIELLVVVLIISILAAVAVPQYMRAVEKSRAMQVVAMLKIIGDAQEIYYMANGEYADNFDDLGIDVLGTDDYSSGWKRKRDAHFDFGTKSSVSVNIIAVSNRISNWESHSGAKYYIVRFAKDNNLYCHEGSEGDDGLCKSLSGGEKKTIEDRSFYVIH